MAISDTHYKKDMFAIRDFLAVQLKKHRDKKLIEQEDIMNTFGTHSLTYLLTYSLTHLLVHRYKSNKGNA